MTIPSLPDLARAVHCPCCDEPRQPPVVGPCKCGLTLEEAHRAQELNDVAEQQEAERASDAAETELPYLWLEGPDGLLVRRRS